MIPDARRAARIGAALILLALIGFFAFPGHTYLQSDTQIYIPIFERIENPNLYARDFLIGTAHIGLTVYDETAIWLRRLTGGGFEAVLEGEQILFRALGLLGVFLIATSFGLGDAAALIIAACYGMGTAIAGPAVLSVEYEPVPRGFAVAFLLLATGLWLRGRYSWACAAASIGFLYHSPATIPFWILFGIALVRERRWRSLWPLAVAIVLLAITFFTQRGVLRPQPLFATIDPEWEQIIRMRTTYDWIGMWPVGAVLAFVLFSGFAIAAVWRIRSITTSAQRWVLIGFPVLGLGSIGASALLLDHFKWALMAQVQPARATLFIIVFVQINCALAGLSARRWPETGLWFIPVLLPVVNPQFLTAFTWSQAAAVALLAGVIALLNQKPHWLAAPALALAAAWAVPHVAHTINYAPLHTAELDQLSVWARTQTPEQALFVFPTGGRNLEQGVFRAKALRSLYADWKAGGQVNYFRDFALQWRERWHELSSGKLTVEDWRARGVNYVIYSEGPGPGKLGLPVYENGRYRAYRIP